MRAIMVMYDSLNRRFLPPYGDRETVAPNFARLAEHTVTFDQFYVGSLPCMPARRELHTARPGFLHRDWGPIEPFDDSVPEMLGEAGICTHCVTDHYHYWQDGGATYLPRFSTWEMIRGQEGDGWIGSAEDFVTRYNLVRQDVINRKHQTKEEDTCHAMTFQAGLRFLEENADLDGWFLQIEYFDPHEPYFVPERYKKLYTDRPLPFDWPRSEDSADDPDLVYQARTNYRAVLSMADEYLGKLLDFMDAHDMWKDTMLIVNTDHGYLLGEHGFFGKNVMPVYDEIAHIPFFIWDPESGRRGERSSSLAQTMDIGPTLLDYFRVPPTDRMLGRSLRPAAAGKGAARDEVLFGYYGRYAAVSDGRFCYMRCGRRKDAGLLNSYTLMPTHMSTRFSLEELRAGKGRTTDGFSFTRGVPVMVIPSVVHEDDAEMDPMYTGYMKYGDQLFNLEDDPDELHPLDVSAPENRDAVRRMTAMLIRKLEEAEAPEELYTRLGLREEAPDER